MTSLHHFPAPVTVPTGADPPLLCEYNARLLQGACAPPKVHQFLQELPELLSNTPAPKPQVTEAGARSAFLPPRSQCSEKGEPEVGQVTIRKAFRAWLDEGWVSALEALAGSGSQTLTTFSKFVAMLAKSVLGAYRLTHNIHFSLNPHLMMSGEDMICEFTSTRDWRHSRIRALSWHPHTNKIAIAFGDDTIQVMGKSLPINPLLKYKQQRGISCLGWRPLNASELAVGCLTGLLLWNLEPTSVAARPSASCVTVLKAEGHFPVTSVQWDPQGKLLLSCSAADTSMILWNTASETKIPLKRVGGGGVHLVLWSPFTLEPRADGPNGAGRILAATPTTAFRVWETDTWTHERWNVSEGHVQTACWSPCSTILLFTTDQDTLIYALEFGGSGQASNAVAIADVAQVELEGDGYGGRVQCLRWDPFGERLAVTFRDSAVIALFATSINPSLSLTPIGFIRGASNEDSPSVIEFSNKFDDGALLTIGWSSGRLQHVPLLYVPNTDNPRVVQEHLVLNEDFNSSYTQDLNNPLLFSSPQ